MNFYLSRSAMIFLLFTAAFSAVAQINFTENKGQWQNEVSFKSDFSTGSVFLQKAGFTILLHNEDDVKRLSESVHDNTTFSTEGRTQLFRSHAYRVSFKGAALNPAIIKDKVLPGYSNYFLGADRSKWKDNCQTFESVVYKNVYPNIDVHYYSTSGKFKYDIIVHPGGDISKIALQYEGAEGIAVRNNELFIQTSVGEVKETYPYTYQINNGKQRTVSCSYMTKNGAVTFKVGQYSPAATLIIDPTIIFSSFTGSSSDNWGYTATPGPDGSFFAGGVCFGSGFPVSTGAFQQNFQGGIDEDGNGPYDISIFKFSPDGKQRLYATYLGGTGNEQPQSLISDKQGNLIIAGRTNSANYPKLTALIGSGGLYDICISKLNSSGTLLTGSMVIGGSADDGVNIKAEYLPLNVPGHSNGVFETRRNYGDEARSEVILDEVGNIYLASCTQSNDFPVTALALQNVFGGGRQDGVILKLPGSLSGISFGTFFGGSGSDACFNLALNPVNGNLYVSGATTSANLPGNKNGVVNSTMVGGETDGFITEILRAGNGIAKTTYIGTSGNDMVYGLQPDQSGDVYITGTTTGNFPVINAVFSNPGSKQFIAKLNADFSAFVYSTVFGSVAEVPNITPTAFYVDECQNVYVVGWGGEFNSRRGYPNVGTTGLTFLATPGAIKSTTDGKDFFLFVLSKNASSQLYGSFFGQQNGFDDHVDGGTSRFDSKGILYQAICASCTNSGASFPVTPGAWSSVNLSSGCNQVALKIDMNFANKLSAGIKASFNGSSDITHICNLPATVQFTDTVSNGKSYSWYYGDGSVTADTLTASSSASHTYLFGGIFKAMVVAKDPAACNISDTSIVYLKINTCDQSCALSETIYASDISGSNYQWQVNTSAGFANIDEGANYSGTNMLQLKFSNPLTSWYGYQYRCLVNGVSSTIFTFRIVNYWLGSADNKWENPQNWSCGTVPDSFTDAVINTGRVVVNSNISVATVRVTPGAELIINPVYNLTLVGH